MVLTYTGEHVPYMPMHYAFHFMSGSSRKPSQLRVKSGFLLKFDG